MSPRWEDPVPHRVTDLSEEGLWVQTLFPLGIGEHLFVCLRPPRWPVGQELLASAAVRRAQSCTSASEPGCAGMGLELLDLTADEQRRLGVVLRGLPPPLAPRSGRPGVERRLVWVDTLLTWHEDLGDRVNSFEVSECLGALADDDFIIEPAAPLCVAC